MLEPFYLSFQRLFADEAIPLAGNIAFRTVFSLFPFLIFLSTLAGFFGSEGLAEKVVTFLLNVAPQQLVMPLAPEVHRLLTEPRSGLLSLSAALTIWSAVSGVDSVRMALNRAYDLKETRSIIYVNALNVMFVIGAGVFMLAVALLLILIPLAVKPLTLIAPETMVHWATIDTFRFPLALVLLVTGLFIAHRVLPAQALPWRALLPGVLFTVFGWSVLSVLFTFWLSRISSFATTYSSLSGIFAVMFFIYIAALTLILGGEFNRVLKTFDKSDGQKTLF